MVKMALVPTLKGVTLAGVNLVTVTTATIGLNAQVRKCVAHEETFKALTHSYLM